MSVVTDPLACYEPSSCVCAHHLAGGSGVPRANSLSGEVLFPGSKSTTGIFVHTIEVVVTLGIFLPNFGSFICFYSSDEGAMKLNGANFSFIAPSSEEI